MLVDTIKQDMITAWKKQKDSSLYALKKDTLSFLLSKIKNRAIELKVEALPDSEVLSIIQKMIKELNDEKANFEKFGLERVNDVVRVSTQLSFIENYLPEQLTEDEIRYIIHDQSLSGIPEIMKYFKTYYAGQVDMALVNKIARG
jgi:hypothetical protein